MAVSLTAIGSLHYNSGNIERGLEFLRKSEGLFTELGRENDTIRLRCKIGHSYILSGDHEKAEDILLTSYDLEERKDNKEQNQSDREIPHYDTRKQEQSPSSLKKLTKKLLKVGKFLGFTVLTIALMRLGFVVGMWLAYGLITLVIAFISYQIFMGDSD